MSDTPSSLMESADFMTSLSAGDPGATERWYSAHQAAFPEADVPLRPSPSLRPAGTPSVAQSAIKAMMADAEAMKGVNSGDEAALRRWNDLHKAAYPSGADQLDARGYTFAVPSWAEPDPQLQEQAATMFAAIGVPPREAAGLSDLWHEAASCNLDPATIELMGQETEAGLVAELGRAGAARLIEAGRQLVREAERHMPGLRALLADTGAGNHPGFVRRVGELALARQRGR